MKSKIGRTTRRRSCGWACAWMAAAGLWLQPAVAHADRNVSFTTTQGTWMSVDVSPDGKTIVFDLLGDLYTLPIAGGTGRPASPKDAPSIRSRAGRRTAGSIAFASDRSGSDNIWIAAADGSEPARGDQRSKDGGITAPAWTADGEYRDRAQGSHAQPPRFGGALALSDRAADRAACW